MQSPSLFQPVVSRQENFFSGDFRDQNRKNFLARFARHHFLFSKGKKYKMNLRRSRILTRLSPSLWPWHYNCAFWHSLQYNFVFSIGMLGKLLGVVGGSEYFFFFFFFFFFLWRIVLRIRPNKMERNFEHTHTSCATFCWHVWRSQECEWRI